MCLGLNYTFHCQRYTPALQIHRHNFHIHRLLHPHHAVGIGYALVCELRNMYQSLGLDAEVHKATEIGDVGNHARKLHSLAQVLDCLYRGVETEFCQLLARVSPGLFQFRYNIPQGFLSEALCQISVHIYPRPALRVSYQVGGRATGIAGHAFHQRIALRVDSAVVKRVVRSGNTQETRTLFKYLGPEPGHLHQCLTVLEVTMFATIGNNFIGQRGTKTGNV